MTVPVRDERGQTTTLFVLMMMGSLFLVAGLVIDGGQKVTAATLAESAAAGAARAAGNAAATQQLGGRDPASAAVLAAKAYLAGQAVGPRLGQRGRRRRDRHHVLLGGHDLPQRPRTRHRPPARAQPDPPSSPPDVPGDATSRTAHNRASHCPDRYIPNCSTPDEAA